MYGNLKAEMARHEISTADLAKAIGRDERTIRNKLSGLTEFNLSEVIKIQNAFFSELGPDYLFFDDGIKAAEDLTEEKELPGPSYVQNRRSHMNRRK